MEAGVENLHKISLGVCFDILILYSFSLKVIYVYDLIWYLCVFTEELLKLINKLPNVTVNGSSVKQDSATQ